MSEELTFSTYEQLTGSGAQAKQQKSDKIVRTTVKSVDIVFDGNTYSAELGKDGMTAKGFNYWVDSSYGEIMIAKANLFSEHINKFGWLNQADPTKPFEKMPTAITKTIKSVRKLIPIDEARLTDES